METILLTLIVGTLNVVCFLIGVKAGRREEIKAPDPSKINPMTIYRERQDKKEAQKELSKLEAIERNLSRYDGTPFGQEDI